MYYYRRGVIELALDNLIKSIDGKDDKDSNLIRESAKRTKAILSHIVIKGADDIGKTYEELLADLESKPNVYILSDEELRELENTKKLFNLILRAGFKLSDE